MKACIIQPPYSRDLSFSDEYFQYKLDLLDRCDGSVDVIVLPEYSDVPCATSTKEETLFYHRKYIDRLLEKCVETAKRCNALVFVNALCLTDTGYRNTTYAYNRRGELVGRYYKRHLPPLEFETLELDSDYTFLPSEPYVIEIEGVRYGFLTCYDFYFYEAFARIAREKVDVIIGCSLQRSDTHSAIEIMCRFLAYNTNAYVLRSSVSFDENATVCGASMAVSPKGEVLLNMGAKFGMGTVEFDPCDKYYKPAGFGRGDAPHYEYIEYGRKPWQYRPAGSSVVLPDRLMPYPRVCAHRGFNTVAPENSMPAFGAAIAMGAEEIEFDLWPSRDRIWVSIHDYRLDRVSDGEGFVWDYTLEELRRFDFGSKFSEKYKGLRILTFEDILKKLSCQTVMNVHVKDKVSEGYGDGSGEVYDDALLMDMINLIRKYGAEEHVYFMTASVKLMQRLYELAPDIRRCMGENRDTKTDIVDRALICHAHKVQLFKPYFDASLIEKAKKNGIKCNVFFADEPKEAERYIEMGIDTILTNDYNLVSQAVKRRD